jgi:hypothetical protein
VALVEAGRSSSVVSVCRSPTLVPEWLDNMLRPGSKSSSFVDCAALELMGGWFVNVDSDCPAAETDCSLHTVTHACRIRIDS